MEKRKIKKNSNKGRAIDEKMRRTGQLLQSRFVAISSMEVRAWKAILTIVFVVGFFAALIWGAYNKWYIESGAKEGVNNNKVEISAEFDKDSWKAGESISANIVLNTASKNIVAAYVVGQFDASLVEVTGIDVSSSDFSLEIAKNFSNATGTFSVALAQKTPGVSSEKARVASINFRSFKDISALPLKIKFDTKEAKDDSAAIMDDGRGTNALDLVSALCTSCSRAIDPICGDGQCKGDESCSTCEIDCGACKIKTPEKKCGDGQCDSDESCSTCDKDCGVCVAEDKFMPTAMIDKKNSILSTEDPYLTKSKKVTFKSTNLEIAKGKVRIFQDGKLKKIVNVKKSGAWKKDFNIKKNKTYEFQFKFYDEAGKEIYASDTLEIVKVK